MRNNRFLILILALAPALVDAQPFVLSSKPSDNSHGISSKLLYEVIIDSKIGREEMIKITRQSFIANLLLDSANFPLKDISEQRTEYNLPLSFRLSVYFGKASMGVRTFKAPARLYFNGKFTFEGTKLKIGFTDFAEVPFYLVRNNKYYMGQNKGLDDNFIEMRDSVYIYYNASTYETSIMAKAMLMLVGGLDDYQATINDLNVAMNKQFRLYDSVVSAGAARWVSSKEEMLALLDKNIPGAKYQIPMIRERVEKGYLLVIDNDRWEKQCEKIFNAFFMDVAKRVRGNVIGIAKDGVVKYVPQGDQLVLKK